MAFICSGVRPTTTQAPPLTGRPSRRSRTAPPTRYFFMVAASRRHAMHRLHQFVDVADLAAGLPVVHGDMPTTSLDVLARLVVRHALYPDVGVERPVRQPTRDRIRSYVARRNRPLTADHRVGKEGVRTFG